MQIGSIIGLVGVFVMVCLGALWGRPGVWYEILGAYLDIPSTFITIGGTTMVFILAYTSKEYRGIFRYFRLIFNIPKFDPIAVIPTMVSLSEKARREGLLSLEDNLEEITDDFLKRALQLVIDGTDPELVKTIMNIRNSKMEDRHNAAISVFNMIEIRAPAFGLMGTILGLVQLLRNLKDPGTLGPSLAVALLTTFYGVIIANAIAGPIQTKLAKMNDEEMLVRNLMIEGVLAIQSGDNPRIVEEKLLSFLSSANATQYALSRGEK